MTRALPRIGEHGGRGQPTTLAERPTAVADDGEPIRIDREAEISGQTPLSPFGHAQPRTPSLLHSACPARPSAAQTPKPRGDHHREISRSQELLHGPDRMPSRRPHEQQEAQVQPLLGHGGRVELTTHIDPSHRAPQPGVPLEHRDRQPCRSMTGSAMDLDQARRRQPLDQTIQALDPRRLPTSMYTTPLERFDTRT